MSRWICEKCHFDHELTGEPHCPIYPFVKVGDFMHMNGQCKGHILTNEDYRAHTHREIGSPKAQHEADESNTIHINLTTISANNHCLSITDEHSRHHVFYLTADQCLLLAYQAIMSLWTFYKIVPK